MELAGLAIFLFFVVTSTQLGNESKRIKACKDAGGVMVEVSKGKSECKLPPPTP